MLFSRLFQKKYFLVGWFFFNLNCLALDQTNDLGEVEGLTVSSSSDSSEKPSLSLGQSELQKKLPSNLGEALVDELGMSSSSFGQSANRPVIRGMAGSRAPIFLNGLNSGDVSSVSSDHAVASEVLFDQQVEILRGGESLRYSSSANQGMINLIDGRTPSTLLSAPSLSFVSQYNLNNQGFTNGLLIEDSVGQWTLHVDGTSRQTNNYQRTDGQSQSNSFDHHDDIGFGASYFRDDGYSGFSISQYQNFYGIPSVEGSQIDLKQNRYQFIDNLNTPFDGFSKMSTKLSYVDYSHQERSATGIPQTQFTNKAFDGRIELFHRPINAWLGSFGIQLSQSHLLATDLTNPLLSAAIIPSTQSMNLAAFIVENKTFSAVDVQHALRYELVQLHPNNNIPYSDNANFSTPVGTIAPNTIAPVNANFSLISLSTQGSWNYSSGYSLGLRYSLTQRAPGVDELYSFGNHDATATFDVGNPQLSKETSNHVELGWRKNTGLVHGKLNLYHDIVSNYIYGFYTGSVDQQTNYPVRQFLQSDAKLQGIETEILYNPNGSGFSARFFGDSSRGVFTQGGYLPLQPATRLGGFIAYSYNNWKSNLSLIHAFGQSDTAYSTFYSEPSTSSYNKLDLKIAKALSFGKVMGTIYLQGSNLLNDTIRYSTTIDTLRINAPLPGRALVAGVKIDY